jgi:hypothetical protein
METQLKNSIIRKISIAKDFIYKAAKLYNNRALHLASDERSEITRVMTELSEAFENLDEVVSTYYKAD